MRENVIQLHAQGMSAESIAALVRWPLKKVLRTIHSRERTAAPVVQMTVEKQIDLAIRLLDHAPTKNCAALAAALANALTEALEIEAGRGSEPAPGSEIEAGRGSDVELEPTAPGPGTGRNHCIL